MDKKDALGEIDKRQAALTALSDSIWDAAETGYREARSAQLLCHALEGEGFAVTRGVAGIPTAFLGKWGSGSPVIGVLGEYDALPGPSQAPDAEIILPVTQSGNSHSCGHNLLGVGSLAAAVAAAAFLRARSLPGTIIYYGCPAEEGGSGKTFMARAGAFDALDCAFTWHPCDYNGVSVGSTLANIQMCYRFYGVSAHAAAAPHLGRSALDAVELMNVGANFLREHILPEARIHYAITNAGGSSPGTVQPYAEVLYLIRAPEISQTREIRDRIDNIARGAALMTDTRVEPVFIKACSNIMPSRLLEEVLYRNMRAVARPRYTREELRRAAAFLSGADPEPGIAAVRTAVVPYRHTRQAQPGSSDVGDVSWICPTAQILTATWAAGTQAHTWQAFAQGKGAVAHKGMLYAGKVLAGAILDMLEQPQLAEQAKAEHKAQLGGRVYESPVPDGVKPDAAGAWAK